MLRPLVLAGALLCALTVNAEAHHRHRVAHAPACVETFDLMHPCSWGEPIAASAGEHRRARSAIRRPSRDQATDTSILPHPGGCPRTAFCGCGAAVHIFGAPIRSLWLAANWFRFPRTEPASGMVAVRRHHVFVLEQNISGNVWLVFDANSGRHATRIHPRSIAGYVIVNPRG